MKKPLFHKRTLSCGMRIVCTSSHSDVVYCGVAVDAGTRDELESESGLAHFAEHLCFKGTSRRTARQIITRMESVGGDLNAYTGKEETVYYCTLLRPHLNRAIDLLLDIVLCSTYPQREMDREVEVVNDEIESYNASPSELSYDEFESLVFPQHSLGRNILGNAQRLRQSTTSDVQAFARRLYRPERMIFFVHGNVQPDEIANAIEKRLEQYVAEGTARWVEAEYPVALPRTPFDLSVPLKAETIHRSRSTHQAHVMMGTRCFGATDPRHLSLYLLNNLLGGPGMSSRLNLALRERRGLVYTVESNLVCYSDSGVWSVYFGCDHEDVNLCCSLVMKELQRLSEKPLSQRALDAARRQIKGQIGVSYDNSESVALGMAKRFLHYGTTQTAEELFARLDALTADQLWNTAQQIFNPKQILTLVYG